MVEILVGLIGIVQDEGRDYSDPLESAVVANTVLAEYLAYSGVILPVRCQNCGWWHRHKQGDLSRGVCDKYAMSKSENGYCDEPLLEERKRF